MLEDFSQRKHIATWNPARTVWETTQANLTCGHLGLFSATLPTSGMTQGGRLFELPKREPRTVVSESLSLPTLATPNTMDSLPPRYGEAYEKVKNAGGRKNRVSSGNLREQVVHLLPLPQVSEQLQTLPTPTVSQGRNATAGRQPDSQHHGGVTLHDLVFDGTLQPVNTLPTPTVVDLGGNKTVEEWDEWTARMKEKHGNGNGHGASLNIEALRTLPTPQVDDSKNTGHNETRRPTLASETYKLGNVERSWGKFEPAIRRWEAILGRPAPEPTKPDGKDGAHRLSSKFTEWMMGLPEGWITDAGLKRNDELKACGNGVVPQQAKLALQLLLTDSNIAQIGNE